MGATRFDRAAGRSVGRTAGAAALSLAFAGLAQANFTASGTFKYVDRAFTYGGGFSGSEPELPVRLARVEVINNANGAVLASGSTLEDGTFSIAVTGAGTADVVVRCFARSDSFGSNRLRVTNTGGTLYSTSSSVFSGWNLSTNLAIGTVVAQKVLSGSYQGGPFNMLDQMVSGIQYVKAQGAGNPTSNLIMEWPGGSGSFASGTTANMADDDGFDDLVQLHEFGHVVHDHYSDSDNPGGSHTFGDSDQDPRLSYGEGWASWFGGAVRRFAGIADPGFYLDAAGTGGGGVQLHLRFETGSPYTTSTAGEADEGAVACALWEIIDTPATDDTSDGVDDDAVDGSFGFTGVASADEMHWEGFTGPVNSAANCTIRDAFYAFFDPIDYGHYAEVSAAFDGWGMRFSNDALEPNNSSAAATAFTTGTSWSATRTLYYSAAATPSPGDGDSDHYAFTVSTAGATIEAETRYPGGDPDAETYCDPYIVLRRPNGTIHSQTDSGGTGRNAALTVAADATGAWTLEVKTIHAYRKTGSYQVRIEIVGEPPPPGSDCNGNGVDDTADIAAGTSFDFDGNAQPDECQSFSVDEVALSLFFGGTQGMTLDAGAAFAGQLYWVLGSASGTTPGVPVDGLVLPLNIDTWFLHTLSFPNQAPLVGTLGTLDGSGQGSAALVLPAFSSIDLLGISLDHAFFAFDGVAVSFTSNAMPLFFVF